MCLYRQNTPPDRDDRVLVLAGGILATNNGIPPKPDIGRVIHFTVNTQLEFILPVGSCQMCSRDHI